MIALRGLTKVAVVAGVLTLCVGSAAYAADGGNLILGHDNDAASTTSINATHTFIDPPPAGTGLWANGSIGLLGSTSGFDIGPPDELVGVVGIGSDEGGWFSGVDSGLTGIAGDQGAGVTGKGTTGVAADGEDVGVAASGATAIVATGAVTFSTSGLVTIAKGKTSATINPGIDVDTNTKVLVTPQSGGGTFQRVGRAFADNPNGRIVFYLTAKAKSAVTLAYFIIS